MWGVKVLVFSACKHHHPFKKHRHRHKSNPLMDCSCGLLPRLQHEEGRWSDRILIGGWGVEGCSCISFRDLSTLFTTASSGSKRALAGRKTIHIRRDVNKHAYSKTEAGSLSVNLWASLKLQVWFHICPGFSQPMTTSTINYSKPTLICPLVLLQQNSTYSTTLSSLFYGDYYF